jgi:hypothetical protein
MIGGGLTSHEDAVVGCCSSICAGRLSLALSALLRPRRCWKSWRLRIFVTASRSDFNAFSIPAAKIRPPPDTLSVFDAVPFLACPCVWLRAGFSHHNR